MNDDFDSILEQCLSQVAAGKARSESCLLAYPSLSDDLEPLLRAADWVRAIPAPELSAEARARIEASVLRRARTRPRLRLPSLKLQASRPGWRWALAGLGAVLVVALVVAIASAATPGVLPGSPVYPIKLATEQAWLWVTPANEKPDTLLHIAQRRLEELQALAARGTFDVKAAQSMTQRVDTALEAVPSLPASLALPVLQEADALNQEQRQVLMGLLSTQPMAARQSVQAALQANGAQADRTRDLFELLEDRAPSGPVEKPASPGQMQATEAPAQAGTPQAPGQVSSPQPPGQTNTPQPPGRTKTLEPDGQSKPATPPGLLKTPEPPGLEKKDNPKKDSPPAREPKPTKKPKE